MTPLLAVNNLAVRAQMHGRSFDIVEDVTFSLAKGEILGLVGESGSGKSVTCRALLRLLPGANLAIAAGEILLQCIQCNSVDRQKRLA